MDNEKLGKIAWYGADGDDFDEAASIHAEIDGTPFSSSDDTDMPGALVFSTTADGTGSSAERMRIDSSGNATFAGDVTVERDSADTTFKVSRSDQTNIQLVSAGQSYVRASAALSLQSNGANTALTLDTSQNATFEGTVQANTGSKITSASADTTFSIETTSGTTIFPVLDLVSSHSSVGGKIRQGGSDVISFDKSQNATFAGNLVINGSQFDYFRAVNSGNPEFHMGSSDTNKLHIQTVYTSSAQTLNYVTFTTKSSLTSTDAGKMEFYVDEVKKLTIDDAGIDVAGALSKSSGSFKIDHPLTSKKDTHYLVHSFVEAPQADNIYRGKATLSNGTIEINLDTSSGMSEGTFVLLNTDIQCFTSNESDWDAVKGSVNGNILTISCQNTNSTANVSWLVIGERQDQHMIDVNWTDENGKVIVEPEKIIN